MESQINQTPVTVTTAFFAKFLSQVYGWMTLGLLVSFAISAVIYVYAYNNPALITALYIAMFVSIFIQLGLVFVISSKAATMSSVSAGLLFIAYSALNGLTLGLFTMYFELGSIATAFLAGVLTFAVMSVVGFFVKRDLTGIAGLAFFGLIGIVLGSLINVFLYFLFPQLAVGFTWILTYVGIGVFLILIAYDTQKLKKFASNAEASGLSVGGVAVQGALTLYLDFINMFMRLLLIFGKRR